MAMITDIEDFFDRGCGRCDRFDTPECSTRPFEAGLRALRALCRQVGLSEHVKWAHPCYMHAGRNICILGAFRGDFRLSFMDAALLADPEGILERQGENTRHPDCIRFTENRQVTEMAPVIRAYLAEAMGYAAAGIKPARAPSDVALPEELVTALDEDPALAEAFAALTPGRQKSWVLQIGGAKKAETRAARVEKGRDRILAGKGATER
ncbi:MAG: hypothetical protein HLUCCA08_04975 [Rhodobacteraceae bacterium HLUCCA08]|nr:MAG: hypothetical protein HLUCCA08_04975 [Rhodobacteraceae bacterium HLUCCA08]